MRRPSMFVVALVASGLAFSGLATPVGRADEPARPPSLPKGFTPSSGKLGKPTVRKTGHGGMQSDHEFTFPTRPALPGDRADIASLPVVEIGAEDDVEAAPPATLPEGDAGDLVVLKVGGGARLSLQGFEAGILTLGKRNPVATGRQSQGGVPDACGPKAKAGGVVPFRFDAMRRIDPSGNLELVWGRGYLDASTCSVAVVARHVARPKHLAGGIVYAFCTHRKDPRPGAPPDALHVLTPQGQSGKFDVALPFEHRVLALAKGTSAAFEATLGTMSSSVIGGWGMPSWYELVKAQCAVDKTFCFNDVRLEVSQGKGESAPTAFLGGDFSPPK